MVRNLARAPDNRAAKKIALPSGVEKRLVEIPPLAAGMIDRRATAIASWPS